jgi:hypothetical protein
VDSRAESDEVWSETEGRERGRSNPPSAFVEAQEKWGFKKSWGLGDIVAKAIGVEARNKLYHQHYYREYKVDAIGTLTRGGAGPPLDLGMYGSEHEKVRKQADIANGAMAEAVEIMERTVANEKIMRDQLDLDMAKGYQLSDRVAAVRKTVDEEHKNSKNWLGKSKELTDRDIAVRKNAAERIREAHAVMQYTLVAMDDKERLDLNTTSQREVQEIEVGVLDNVQSSQKRVVVSQKLLVTLQEQASSDMSDFGKGMQTMEQENEAAEGNLKTADAANAAVKNLEKEIEKVVEHALYNAEAPVYNTFGFDAAPPP